jgi:hypothetical protein
MGRRLLRSSKADPWETSLETVDWSLGRSRSVRPEYMAVSSEDGERYLLRLLPADMTFKRENDVVSG